MIRGMSSTRHGGRAAVETWAASDDSIVTACGASTAVRAADPLACGCGAGDVDAAGIAGRQPATTTAITIHDETRCPTDDRTLTWSGCAANPRSRRRWGQHGGFSCRLARRERRQRSRTHMQFTLARVVLAPYTLADRNRELAGVLRSSLVRRGVWPLVRRTRPAGTRGSSCRPLHTRARSPACSHRSRRTCDPCRP